MKLKYIMSLADTIRYAAQHGFGFTPDQIEVLAQFCGRNYSAFDKPGWLAYIRDGPKQR